MYLLTCHRLNLVELERINLKILFGLLNCSDNDYEGGDLFLFRDKDVKVENFGPGSAVVFPSFISHKVEKIISGSRATLAIWMNGPKFR